MIQVRKNNGTLEEFDRGKLSTSLEKAGATSVDALNIAYRIGSRVKQGTTTIEIRESAITELRALDEKAVHAYDSPKSKIVARRTALTTRKRIVRDSHQSRKKDTGLLGALQRA